MRRSTYITRGLDGCSPLAVALRLQQTEIAHYLVAEAPWSPRHAGSVLAALNAEGECALPFYPGLVARCPLTAKQWAQVPLACPRLGTALPAALRRSEAEAALLVRHMPDHERHYLRTLALYLGIAQRRGQLPQLPVPVADCLLAECAAHYAAAPPGQQRAWQLQRLQQLTGPQKVELLLLGVTLAAAAAAALLLPALKRPMPK